MQTETSYASLMPRDDINARSTNRGDGIDELAAMIKSKGLIQPIVVRDAGKGKLQIIAGNRRHAAIGKLIAAGDWPADKPVAITVREESVIEARETSLIENIARRAMHPVDEFEVFAQVHAKEKDTAKIAERYGISVRIVQQRLALGRLAPEILAAWRSGQIKADTAMAFAICPDPKQQAAALKALTKAHQLYPHAITQHFKKGRPAIDCERMKLVGVEAYKAAGGTLVESLFGDGYVENAKLLDKMVEQKLQAICDGLLADGWSWVEIEKPGSYAHHGWGTLTAKRKPTAEEKAHRAALETEHKDLRAKIDALPEDEDDEDLQDCVKAIKEKIGALDDAAQARGFSAEQKKKSGCLVGQWGRVTYGKVRNVSQAKLDNKAKKAKAAAAGESPAADEPTISEALRVDITGRQSEAIALALAEAPDVAVQAVAAVLAMAQHAYGYGESPLRLKADGMSRRGFAPVSENDEDLDEDLDDDADDAGDEGTKSSGFAKAFAGIAPGQAAQVLAVAIAKAIDVRQIKYKPVAQIDVDTLVAALPGSVYTAKMLQAFDAADYFTRASGKIAAAALAEMGVTEKAPKGKAELATFVSAKAIEHKWLPLELRHPQPAAPAAGKPKAVKKAA